MLPIREKFRLLGFSFGIFLSYSFMAIAIEQIFKRDFDGEMFTFSISFVALQCLVYTSVAKVITISFSGKANNETSQKFFVVISIFYLSGMISAYLALQYVSYPVQVIGKACRPIPIMIFGFLIVRKTYSLQKCCFVLMIVIGIITFIYDASSKKTQSDQSYIGNILIGLSLLSDGLLGAVQDFMRKSSKPSAINFMYYTNAYSSLFSTAIALLSGEAIEFVRFCMNHYIVLAYLLAVVFTGSFGQYFISCMISNFGSLPLALVTTLRKFTTVMVSVFLFQNALSLQQWIGTTVIFLALTLDVVFGSKQFKLGNSTEQSSDDEQNKSNSSVQSKTQEEEQKHTIKV